MKLNSTILAAALGLASAGIASATNYIYYTGSTAARDAVYNTLIAGVGFDHVPTFAGYGSGTAGNCSWMIFSNTVSSTPTIVKCAWSGSEAGIVDVSGSTPELFLADSTLATPGANSGQPTGLTNDIHTVDIAQADNALAYSKTPGSTATAINDQLVIPFVFVKNATTISDQGAFGNITSDNFKNLAQGGDKLALFTGNSADTSTYVYLAGRDDNSGTRANTFGLTGWGIHKAPNQVVLSGATPNAMTDPLGDGSYQTPQGQSSGGTLAKSLTDTTTSTDQVHGGTGFIAVAYLGLSDDATAEGSPYNAVRLTYNGTSYSVANVQSGLYTVWGYEFTLYRSGASTAAQNLANSIVNNIGSYTSGYEIAASTMKCTRTGPTAYPVHK